MEFNRSIKFKLPSFQYNKENVLTLSVSCCPFRPFHRFCLICLFTVYCIKRRRSRSHAATYSILLSIFRKSCTRRPFFRRNSNPLLSFHLQRKKGWFLFLLVWSAWKNLSYPLEFERFYLKICQAAFLRYYLVTVEDKTRLTPSP